MRELGSKAEVAERQRTTEAETERRIEDAEVHAKEATVVRETFDLIVAPAVTEFVDNLRQITEGLERRIDEEAQKHLAEVESGIEAEVDEVSEPTLEASESADESARKLEQGAERSGRYGAEASEAKDQQDELASFLKGIAEINEDHQQHSREQAERVSEDARNAASGLSRF